MLTPPSALGLGAAWQGRGRALCALSYLGILIREVQAWGRFGWREPGAALGPSRAGTALSVLTLPMDTDLLPFECPWEVPRHTTSPVPHLHALAALPTDSEHPFLCQVRWEQGPDTPNSAGCAVGGSGLCGGARLLLQAGTSPRIQGCSDLLHAVVEQREGGSV